MIEIPTDFHKYVKQLQTELAKDPIEFVAKDKYQYPITEEARKAKNRYQKKYYHSHSKKILEQQRIYVEKNRDRIRAMRKRRYREDHERRVAKARIANKLYYEKNRAKVCANRRLRYHKNKTAVNK